MDTRSVCSSSSTQQFLYFRPLTDHRFYLHSRHEIESAQDLNLQYVRFLRGGFFSLQPRFYLGFVSPHLARFVPLLTCCSNSSRFLLSTNVVTLKSIFMSHLYHPVGHPGAIPSDRICVTVHVRKTIRLVHTQEAIHSRETFHPVCGREAIHA